MSTPLSKEEAYARLGSITREMHEALTVLGGNQLQTIVEEIPNARDRLAYVGKMTEDAANKVLTLVEQLPSVQPHFELEPIRRRMESLLAIAEQSP